jgi:outer membrane protein OmpA-like peptidoglycan-associated protein
MVDESITCLIRQGEQMKKQKCFTVFFVCLILNLTHISSYAEVVEHPVIKPIPKSILENSSKHKDYTYEFPFYDNKENIINYKKIKGTFWKLSYNIFGKDSQRNDGVFTAIEIIRTYRNFVLEKGGEILWERCEGGRLTFKIPKPDGNNTWCHVTARNGYYELDIVEIETAEKKTPPVVSEMKKELDVKGRITIYSILFDFDKHEIKKESLKALREIADLLLDYPSLHLEIQGHTDNQGDVDYNMRLSQKRAESVKQHLTDLGVAFLRLSVKGYGSSKPVASNNTKQGRAKNRRVVLVEK